MDFLFSLASTYPPRFHLLSSSLHPPSPQVSFPYRFRIVSASGSENDRRTIGERYGNDTRTIRDQYGIDTRSIRDRYETDMLLFPSEEINKKFNFSINIYMCYFLHFTNSQHLVSRPKTKNTRFAKTRHLYKDNLPPSRMQGD